MTRSAHNEDRKIDIIEVKSDDPPSRPWQNELDNAMEVLSRYMLFFDGVYEISGSVLKIEKEIDTWESSNNIFVTFFLV